MRLDRPEEIVDVLLANVFDPEVVDNEGELDWSRDVFPQSGSMWYLIVPVWFESLF